MIKQSFLAGAIGVGLVLSGAVTAHAGKADEVFRYHDDFEIVDPVLSEACGYEVTVSIDAYGTVRLFDDGRVMANEHGTQILSANGRSLTNTWAGLFKGQSSETFNEDGTLTVDFDDNNYGLHSKWVGDDGGVLIMDRGRAHFVGTAVIDLETGELISLEETIDTSGPHPILDQGGLEPADACAYFDA
jgi:hypothetical protein